MPHQPNPADTSTADGTSPDRPTDPAQLLALVSDLLHEAASVTWARAELEGPFGVTYSLAHAIHSAATLAANLVPEGTDLPPAVSDVSPGDTAAALTRAEQLLGSVPVEDLPAGSSRLVTMLADLTRQAQP